MEYYSLNNYLRDTFGRKLYKLSLDSGFTCPNRDGRIDTRGCVFCSAGGSGDFASDKRLAIAEQIEQAKARVSRKIHDDGSACYIAYFQAFTNTYAPVDQLRRLYIEAIEHPQIAVLSIATRPDCLPEEVIELLSEMNRIKPVWVELGLQTIHPGTAEYIRRGYDLSVYEDAIRRLKSAGIAHIVTHVILGLPGETEEMMLETVSYVGKSGADGIKLQLLHVIRGTDLARDYEAGLFPAMEFEEYVQLIPKCLAVLPEKMVIHRLTGDGDKRSLIAPLWSGDKKRVLNAVNQAVANA